MLTLFPQLLDYSFFGPTVLRVATGLWLFILAYQVGFGSKKEVKELLSYFPIFKPQSILIGIATVSPVILAGFIFVGLYTQITAILMILVCLKMLTLRYIYGLKFGFDQSVYLVLIAMQIAILIMGPGALSIDLPL